MFLQLAKASGKLLRGNEPDLNTAARMVLYDYQRGKIPFFTLPPGHTADAPPPPDTPAPSAVPAAAAAAPAAAAAVPESAVAAAAGAGGGSVAVGPEEGEEQPALVHAVTVCLAYLEKRAGHAPTLISKDLARQLYV